MSRSRLPPVPGRGGGRPLPPEPPAGGSGDAPPPLPSRPAHGNKPSMKLPPPPVQNGQSPESSDDEGLTYEEPDLPAEPPRARHQPPPPPMEPQETYDDLEDVQPEPEDEPQETYDECDLKPVQHQQQQQPMYEEEQLYEAEPSSDDYPPQEQPEDDGLLYEFMPEADDPPAAPKPPPVSHSRPHIPLPPQPNSLPNLPARPPPSRPPDREASPETVPDLPPGRGVPPGKLSNVKKMSGDGPQILGISQEAIGLKRANLKKVVSEDAKEPEPVPEKPAANPEEAGSVKARINMFKQAEKGVKPALATKPFLPVKPQVTSVR